MPLEEDGELIPQEAIGLVLQPVHLDAVLVVASGGVWKKNASAEAIANRTIAREAVPPIRTVHSPRARIQPPRTLTVDRRSVDA
jgi:hypothetical protein